MAEIPLYSFDNIIDLDILEDDFLASEFGMGASLPELNPDDILGLHADKGAATEDFFADEGLNDEVEDAAGDDQIEQDVQDAVKVLLCLSSSLAPTPALQGQVNSAATDPLPTLATSQTMTTSSCMTWEMTPDDNAGTANEINLTMDSDDDDNHDDSSRWSTDINVPDDAVWCMTSVQDWEAGFSAWCNIHHGHSFYRMLPHCAIQCATCLTIIQLSPDGFWYLQN